MGTTLRAELSEKNPYWIEKHRYYELKHFCLQYPIWKKAYTALDGTNTNPELAKYLLKGITEGWSYDILKARLNIPCCKDIYYDLYRRFFWLLDKERG